MEAMTPSFSGQRVVIVGGTSGLGLATAQHLAEQGADVVVVGRRHVDAALTHLPTTATGASVDVHDEQALAELFASLGDFDHLAYTAGEPLALAPIDDLDLGVARDRLEIRLWGAYAAVKHAHRHVRPGGSIVLTSGSAATRPQPSWAIAASICGATEALTRTLALELAPIRVNAVAPGVVRTELWREMTEQQRAQMYAGLAQTLPVARAGEADDVARAYAYLMSSGYTTGTVLAIDGGALLV
jgi:NAD(P)-dependent dehydrogenase (short-subunit alcohol dehydrogenase family)